MNRVRGGTPRREGGCKERTRSGEAPRQAAPHERSRGFLPAEDSGKRQEAPAGPADRRGRTQRNAVSPACCFLLTASLLHPSVSGDVACGGVTRSAVRILVTRHRQPPPARKDPAIRLSRNLQREAPHMEGGNATQQAVRPASPRPFGTRRLKPTRATSDACDPPATRRKSDPSGRSVSHSPWAGLLSQRWVQRHSAPGARPLLPPSDHGRWTDERRYCRSGPR